MDVQVSLPQLSIIIPTLNEAQTLVATIASTQPAPAVECIVVDGGSTDGTPAIAQALGVTVLTATPGRAHQMNVGARAATGELLLFLHGDTRLPLGFDGVIRRTLYPTGGADSATPVVGAFTLQIDDPRPSLRWIEWGVKMRSRWLQLPYGDQAFFLRAQTFWQVGGFPDQPIMEDFAFIKRLRRLGRVAIAPDAVLTSARRWQQRGVLQTTLINQCMVLGYRVGVSPVTLAQWYRGRRDQPFRKP